MTIANGAYDNLDPPDNVCHCGTLIEDLPTVDDCGRRWRTCKACGYAEDIGPAETVSRKQIFRFGK
jgi:hypothetical protein